MMDLHGSLARLMLGFCLISGTAQGKNGSGRSHWILAEIAEGVQGAEIGHYFSEQFSVSGGWLRTRWSHSWKGQDPDTFTDAYRAMLRFSHGALRIGLGPAFRSTKGSAHCDLSYQGQDGEQVRWSMNSIDLVGDIGLLYSSPTFLIGFTVVAAGRQVQRGSAEIETALTLSEDDRRRIEEELRTDTSHGFTLLVGISF